MFTMVARAIAGLLVLVLAGPTLVAAACELTCAMGSHHPGAPASGEAPCHEHQGVTQGAGVQASPSAICHETGAFPSAVLEAWLTTVVQPSAPATAILVAPAITTASMVRPAERGTSFDPRPPHRPLRV